MTHLVQIIGESSCPQATERTNVLLVELDDHVRQWEASHRSRACLRSHALGMAAQKNQAPPPASRIATDTGSTSMVFRWVASMLPGVQAVMRLSCSGAGQQRHSAC